MIQNMLLVVHIFGFLAVVVVLWVMAPHQSARAVFTEFRNGGSWPSIGVSVMVGQISAIYGGLSVLSLCLLPIRRCAVSGEIGLT